MWEEGKVNKAPIWGKYTVEQVAKLEKPIRFYHEEVGEFFFDPAILKIRWEEHPDFDEEQVMFPYWTSPDKKNWHYGVRSFPQMDERTFLALLISAVAQSFFSQNFLLQLHKTIQTKLKESK